MEADAKKAFLWGQCLNVGRTPSEGGQASRPPATRKVRNIVAMFLVLPSLILTHGVFFVHTHTCQMLRFLLYFSTFIPKYYLNLMPYQNFTWEHLV
jgi:hypothetical protein